MDMKVQTPVSQQTASPKSSATREGASTVQQMGEGKATGSATPNFSQTLRSTGAGEANAPATPTANGEAVSEMPLTGFAAAIAALLMPQRDGLSAQQALLSALLGQTPTDGGEGVPGDSETLEQLVETPQGQEWLAQAAYLLGAWGYLTPIAANIDSSATAGDVSGTTSTNDNTAPQALQATLAAPQLSAVLEGLAQVVQEESGNPLTGQVLDGLARLLAGVQAPQAAKGERPALPAAAAGNEGFNAAALLTSDLERLEITAPVVESTKSDKQLKALQMLAYRSGYSLEHYAAVRSQGEEAPETEVNLSSADPSAPQTAHVLSTAREWSNAPVMDRPVVAVPIRELPQALTNLVAKNWSTDVLNGLSEARMILHPEHLGQVDVKLTLQNGQLVAHFTAQQAAGKEALESQMAQLRSNLQAQGYQVERLEVTQSPSLQSGMFQDSRQEQSSRQFSGQNGERTARESEEERFSLDAVQTEQIRQAASGATMDVTA